jgi:hypothetical protein
MLLLADPVHWMRLHISEIAVSLTAMTLVVGGPYVNAGLKNLSRKFHWLLRYGLFLSLSVVGYGIISNFIQRHTKGLLSALPDVELIGAVVGLHLLLAWLLKREGKI